MYDTPIRFALFSASKHNTSRPYIVTKLSVNKYAEQGDEGEEYYEDDGDVEDQALNATPRLENCACTAPTKGTAQSCPTCL